MEQRSNTALGRQGFQKTHGLRKTPEYMIWNGMKQRCHNSKYSGYARYGAKGIFVCDEWMNDFVRFYEDMGPRPSPQHSIEREDSKGPYASWNCRWATLKEQANNKVRTIIINGKTISEISEETGLDMMTIRGRYYRGLSPERIMSAEFLERQDKPGFNRGENAPMAKIKEDDVRKIRALVAGGMMQKDVAPMFGISKSAVGFIISGKRWGHVV
jgi:hypothetical protein